MPSSICCAQCARDHHGIDVDWLGLWNERPWGTPEYVKDLKKAMVAEGLATKLVLGDIPVRAAAVLLSRLHKLCRSHQHQQS